MAKKSDKSSGEKPLHDQRMDARRGVLEELFNDMYDDRRNIYLMNFIRGLFFGLGSALGATVVIAILIWVLSWFVDFPGIGQGIQDLQNSLKSR